MKPSFKFKFFVFVVLCCVQFNYIVTKKQYEYEPCCKDYLDIRCSNGKLALIACKQNCLPNGRTPKYWMGRYCEHGTRGVFYYGCECLIKGIKKQIIWESDYVEKKHFYPTPYQPSNPKPNRDYPITPSTTTELTYPKKYSATLTTQALKRANLQSGVSLEVDKSSTELSKANTENLLVSKISYMNESLGQEMRSSISFSTTLSSGKLTSNPINSLNQTTPSPDKIMYESIAASNSTLVWVIVINTIFMACILLLVLFVIMQKMLKKTNGTQNENRLTQLPNESNHIYDQPVYSYLDLMERRDDDL